MADRDYRRTQWLYALGVVVAVAAVVGTVLGVLTYGAAQVTGLAGPEPEAEDRPARAGDSVAARPRPTTPSVSRAEKKAARPERSDRHRAAADKERGSRSRALPTLSADRHRVHRMQRVNLRGHYPGRAGTQLLVQRLEAGRWQRFPVTVVVRDGRFRTWIASGRPGPNRLRVVDSTTGRASAPVVVTVR